MKKIVDKINALKGEEFARVFVREGVDFPYKTCIIERGEYDEYENFTEDGKFHVSCLDYNVPSNIVRDETFETVADMLEKFTIDGRPLGEVIVDVDDSQIIYVM